MWVLDILRSLKLKSVFSIFSVLYLIIGLGLLIVLIQSNFTPFHVGLLGVLNLIAFYGLNRKERWAIYLAVWLSLTGSVFGYTIIYATFQSSNLGLMETVLLMAMTLYVAFSVVSFFYVIIRRDRFR